MCPNYQLLQAICLAFPAAVVADPAIINVNASQSIGDWVSVNRFFGADEPNYATYLDGGLTLSELGNLGPAQTYFRAHNLLTTGPGYPSLKFGSTNAYTEDADGNPIYNWTIVDGIFDSYLSRNVKPYVEVGFMPEALSTHPEPYFFNFTPTSDYDVIYTGWSYPPTSFEKWGELIHQWAMHNVERYGADEVNTWYWEIWNEPNIAYWNGTADQFYHLHDYAIDGIRRALPAARVGGPGVAGGASGTYLGDFLQHSLDGPNYATGGNNTPLNFISFHAKGAPLFINGSNNQPGYIQMNASTQLVQTDQAFAVIANYSQQDKPIVMSEYDPDGCAACVTPQYGYRNGLLYPSYTAVTFSRALDLAIRRGVNLQGALTWAFEYDPPPVTPEYEGVAYFDGFRVLTTFGIDKPVLNAHRMLGMMSGKRIAANSSAEVPLDEVLANSIRSAPDVGTLVSYDDVTQQLSIFVWHYHDDDVDFPDANVQLQLSDLPYKSAVNMTHWRIDDDHSNAYQKWLAMGSPQASNITHDQQDELVASGKLATLDEPTMMDVKDGCAQVAFDLPIRALSLLTLKPVRNSAR